MPSVSENAKLLAQLKAENLMTEKINQADEATPSRPTPTAPTYPNAPNPMLRTPMPASAVQSPDLQRQFLNPSIPQTRLMQPTAAANPTIGAASTSQALTVAPKSSTAAATGTFLDWQGTWSSTTAYDIDDVVIFNFSAYVALIGNSGVEPDTNTSTWQLLSKNINIRGNYAGLILGTTNHDASQADPNGPSTVSATTTQNNEFLLALTTTFANGVTSFPGWTQMPGTYWTTDNSPGQAFLAVATPTTVSYATTHLHMDSLGWNKSMYVSAIIRFSVTPTIVQGVSDSISPKSFPGNLTAGNTIMVIVQDITASAIGSGFTITDSQGNTYNPLFYDASAAGYLGDFSYMGVYVAYGCSAGANAVTITQSGSYSAFFVTLLELNLAGGTQYYPADVVLYNNSTYINIKKTTALVENPTNTTFWQLLAGASTPYAPINSPAFTGIPTAPTASPLTNDTQIATTAYTDLAVGVETTRAEAAEALLAPLASPVLTGTPALAAATATTPTAGDNSTKVATTAWVVEQGYLTTPGIASGSPIVQHVDKYTSSSVNWSNFSIWGCIRGSQVLSLPSQWTVTVAFTAGTGYSIAAANVMRVLRGGNNTVVDVTVIKFGGATSQIGTFSGASVGNPFLVKSDTISLQISTAYDYYILYYFNADGTYNGTLGVESSFTNSAGTLQCGHAGGNTSITAGNAMTLATSLLTAQMILFWEIASI